jgi:putative acetyltransferase
LGGVKQLIIRTESQNDHKEVFKLNYEAFGKRDNEFKLVERIRSSEEFIPELSIVAELNNQIIGHILLSKAKVVNQKKAQDVIVLAPIAVRPDFQKQGAGSQLIFEGIRRTKDLGYGIILLIGHPTYYPKIGFKPARTFGIELNQFRVSDDVFMVLEVVEGELRKMNGELQYPRAFF